MVLLPLHDALAVVMAPMEKRSSRLSLGCAADAPDASWQMMMRALVVLVKRESDAACPADHPFLVRG